ncbi:hypothetical protein [Candidatus Phytoplasma sp. AldY-WA1]|uniref:hypothetical protein n=1 Tax=Candidatus Phytoplasma sp. AldY-WA1 TaxID=2852100 RepID=UPI00254EE986|nr:hypothetical protein [Candidatus Phytoplasma sp. AldY-WA1]
MTISNIFICLSVVIVSIYVASKYFVKQRIYKFQLIDKMPVFTVDRYDGNNANKILLTILYPNFDPNKYDHLINISYEAKVNSNGMDISTHLFLK